MREERDILTLEDGRRLLQRVQDIRNNKRDPNDTVADLLIAGARISNTVEDISKIVEHSEGVSKENLEIFLVGLTGMKIVQCFIIILNQTTHTIANVKLLLAGRGKSYIINSFVGEGVVPSAEVSNSYTKSCTRVRKGEQWELKVHLTGI